MIKELRERDKAGLELNAKAVEKDGSGLDQACRRVFGSYDAALEAAGLDPKEIRKCCVWTKEEVIQALKERKKAGLDINSGAVRKDGSGLRDGYVRPHK